MVGVVVASLFGVGVATSAVLAGINVAIALLAVFSLLERRTGSGSRPLSRAERACAVLMLAVATFNVCMSSMGLAVRAHGASESMCARLVPWMSVAYLSSKLTMYAFLFLRATLLKTELSRKEVLARKLLKFMLAIFPAFLPWFYFQAGSVFVEGRYCITRMRTETVVLVFTFTDVIVSVLLMYLFWAPLQRHTELASKVNTHSGSGSNAVIKAVAKRTVRLTGIAISSTIAFSTAFTVMTFFHEEESVVWQVLGVLSLTGIDSDLMINLTCCLCINQAWKPSFLRGFRARVARKSTVTPVTPHSSSRFSHPGS